MQTAKFETEPFTCPSCVNKIESVVSRKPGVESAQVMFNSNKVKVAFDESKITADEIAESITRLGYPVLGHKVS